MTPGTYLLTRPARHRCDAAALGPEFITAFLLYGPAHRRTLTFRYHLLAELSVTAHVHVTDASGLWCVTGEPHQLAALGPLWTKHP